MANRWTLEAVPDQSGRVAIVTGANSGIGLETARALAHRGAKVVLACRNPAKALSALDDIRKGAPGCTVEALPLDLSNLAGVRAFATGFLAGRDRLDLLVNNAGVMIPPYGKTADGFELQFGTNHLGHFALTGLLLPLLRATAGARVVTVASLAHRSGRIVFDDLDWHRRRYSAWLAYGQSKLANLLFHFELARRLQASGDGTIAAAAHPGWTNTDLQRHSGFMSRMNPLLAMSPAQGALPTLYAATSPGVRSGQYFGPDGWFEVAGHPREVGCSRAARDPALAARLWQVSEELTGVGFGL